jgi:hypothetical protein
MAQLCPSMARHAPRMNTSLGSGQTQEPSAPQTCPDEAQFGVQQRLVFVISGAHDMDAHWLLALQVWPFASKPLHTPLAALQPLPQVVRTMTLSWQRSETLAWHSEPDPSHSTHAAPSLAQKPPAHGVAQHTLAPETVGVQAPEAQSLPTVQLAPARRRQAPPTSTRSGGQTQRPSMPHTRPEPSQAESQQRLAPLMSTLQSPD